MMSESTNLVLTSSANIHVELIAARHRLADHGKLCFSELIRYIIGERGQLLVDLHTPALSTYPVGSSVPSVAQLDPPSVAKTALVAKPAATPNNIPVTYMLTSRPELAAGKHKQPCMKHLVHGTCTYTAPPHASMSIPQRPTLPTLP